jgi:cell wall-associated NlpC family hydrolase
MHAHRSFVSAFLVCSLFVLTACGVDPELETVPDEARLDEDAAALVGSDVTCNPATESYTFDDSTAPYVDALRNGVRVARFTVGSYTVTVLGYQDRSFSTTGTDGSTVKVRHAWRVRTLPAPFSASMSRADRTIWLRSARQANCDGDKDVLTIASQYAEGRRQIWSGDVRIAGDARYALGCDFHDYMGTGWLPPDGRSMVEADFACQTDGIAPDPDQDASVLGSLDCSGFVRTVYSGRNNFAMLLGSYTAHIEPSFFRYPIDPQTPASHLPRMCHDQYRYGPGRKVVPFRVAAAPTQAELDKLLPGDLIFFNLSDSQASHACCEPSTPNRADTCCEEGITHVGIYMGEESGRYRVMSSRTSMSGPTMGGTSYLTVDPTDGWSTRFRAARRL